ncbi:MAG: di-trans,poly-cis-decaprenylcistransferase [Deltaproteobacteria bacterium]|nr:di-trans,poly-cis-decaprenylcistransferase [Deltaproteobacteria bacterium]
MSATTPASASCPSVPGHVAILMHGSSRWAEERGLSRRDGYEAAARTAREAVRVLQRRGVAHVTLFAPDLAARSTEAPDDPLTHVLVRLLKEDTSLLRDHGMRVRAIGDLDALPTAARRAVESLVEATRDGSGITVWLALSYGARRDLADAVRSLAARVRVGLLLPEEIDESLVRSAMTTADMPDADLVVRTGDAPLGDFLLLEAARAHLFGTEVAWPDVGAETLLEALSWYGRQVERALRHAA